MNKRILELAEQAGVFVGDWAGAGLYSIHNKDEVEKFAELIVEECVNLMENQKEHYYSQVLGQQSAEHYDRVISKGDAFEDAVSIIRSHFRS